MPIRIIRTNKFERKISIQRNTFLSLILLLAVITACEGAVQSAEPVPNVPVSSLIKQATDVIKAGLKDTNPRIRTVAVEAVATSQRTELMPEVQKLLKDEIVPVRFTAAMAVGDTKFIPAKAAVQELTKDSDTNVSIAAAYAMYKLGSPESLEIVRKAITNTNQTIRANATVILGKIGDKENLKILYWVLQDRDSEYKVRLQVVQAIAGLGDEKIYSKLWAMLISSYADDRIMGIEGMGALATRDAKYSLMKMLSDDVLEIRLAAAEQLGKLKDPSGEPEVLEVFTKNLLVGMDSEDRERASVRTAMAIGQIGKESLTRYLPQLLADESKFVRIAAAKAVLLASKEKPV
jgi:HEAT repeat protein